VNSEAIKNLAVAYAAISRCPGYGPTNSADTILVLLDIELALAKQEPTKPQPTKPQLHPDDDIPF
jgi:hypothetical protein